MDTNTNNQKPIVHGHNVTLELHTLGWKAFQDLCAQICEEVLGLPVSIYRDAQDGGQDAVFIYKEKDDLAAVGTVQCKFTSDRKSRLKLSDISSELDSIVELVENGQADTYYFITNKGIDAPVATEVREKIKSLGVSKVQVLGGEWVAKKIQESARLRALVPRVYGLGDLSTILDTRKAEQTQALLGHLMPSFKVYVPTNAHRSAVRVLKDHGIVLLLGAPATGKSMLATILATTTIDDGGHYCFQVDSPAGLLENWNPNESGRFYWIDDAFGPNQLREDYVDQWIAMMNKVKTAISTGNRFVLTSRSHIWNAAKQKLATKNHQLLKDGSAVVNVGELDPDERSQILYNHIKAGNQPQRWKEAIRPYLPGLAENPRLVPEIARRLGDSSYTSGIKIIPSDLEDFVAKPMVFLADTIKELNEAQMASLVLVFLYRSALPIDIGACDLSVLVCEKFGVSVSEIGDSLAELESTFVVTRTDAGNPRWSFIHPTISDAITFILGQRPDLTELYVRGADIETVLSDTYCVGMPYIQDAVVLSESVFDQLVSRLLEVENSLALNRKLFSFLVDRASDSVFIKLITAKPEILERRSPRGWTVRNDDKILLHARALQLRLLPEGLRVNTFEYIERRIKEHLDSGAFFDDRVLSLFPPTKLIELTVSMVELINNDVSEIIVNYEEDAYLNYEPEDAFDDVSRFIDDMRTLYSQTSLVESKLEELTEEVDDAIQRVTDRKHDEDEEWIGEDITPVIVAKSSASRSIFSDVSD